MEIAKKNSINQEIKVELKVNTPEYNRFVALITGFIETESNQKIEGNITNLGIHTNGYDSIRDIEIQIKTLKEDKLKLLAVDTTATTE